MTGGKRSCPGTGPANPFILLDSEATYKLTGAAAAPGMTPNLCTPEQHRLIQQLIQRHQAPILVASALPHAGIFAQLTWAHPARTGGANLLLSPVSRAEGDAFATMMIPVLDRRVPGRAVQLRPEGPQLIQVALAEGTQR